MLQELSEIALIVMVLIVIALALLPLAPEVAGGLFLIVEFMLGVTFLVYLMGGGIIIVASIITDAIKYPLAPSAIIATLVLTAWIWKAIKRGHEERERAEREALEDARPMSKRIERFL